MNNLEVWWLIISALIAIANLALKLIEAKRHQAPDELSLGDGIYC
jgi:hypothetical protein